MYELRKLMGDSNGSLCRGMSADPSTRLAYHHLMNGDLDGAEVRFQRILRDNPQDPEALASVRRAGMGEDFSWDRSSRLYVDLYREAMAGP